MGSFFVFVSLLAFLNIVYGMPAWEYEEDEVSSSLEITGRHCSCSKHHHQCGCCLRIKAHPFHKSIEANVCFNASLVPSPLALDVFMTWNKHELFNKTISAASPPPICFGIPHLKVAKACVKFSKVSIKKGHTGACAALELKALRTEKDIPLGCFYFKGEEGQGLDQGTFLDTESLVSLLEDIFQASTTPNQTPYAAHCALYTDNSDNEKEIAHCLGTQGSEDYQRLSRPHAEALKRQLMMIIIGFVLLLV